MRLATFSMSGKSKVFSQCTEAVRSFFFCKQAGLPTRSCSLVPLMRTPRSAGLWAPGISHSESD
jgi:hypothetical protein